MDIEPMPDASSASAIEGVEMLDFLDEDEVESAESAEGDVDLDSDPNADWPPESAEPAMAAPEVPAPAVPEMTIDFSPSDMEAEEIESTEPEEAAAAPEELESAVESSAMFADSPEEDLFAEIEPAADPIEEVAPIDDVAEPVEIESIDHSDEVAEDDLAAALEPVDAVEQPEPEVAAPVTEAGDDDTADFLGDLEQPEAAAEAEAEDMFAGLEDDAGETSAEDVPAKETPDDLTVDIGREATAVSMPNTPEDAAPADIEVDAEAGFSLREEPEPESATIDVAAPAAEASVTPASTGKPKKKSALPKILMGLVLLLMVAGGAVGGLYFAGMLPGFTGDPSIAGGNTDGTNPGGTPVDGTQPGGNGMADRVNAAEEKLRTLYQAAKTGDQIDGEKLAEAQAFLAQLESEDAEVLAEEPVQQHKARFDELAIAFDQQTRQQAEADRAQRFRDALALAGEPGSFDAGMLEEARKLANAEELKLVEQLEADVAAYEQEQAALAAAQMQQKRDEAIDAVVTAIGTGNGGEWAVAVANLTTDFPDDPLVMKIDETVKSDALGFTTVYLWNMLLDQWSGQNLSELPPEELAEAIEGAQELLAASGDSLPGSAEVQQRIAALQSGTQPTPDIAPLKTSLSETFTSAATKASFVFTTKDGDRYFTAQQPVRKDANYVIQALTDLEGNTEAVELAIADADRSQTGRATIAATSEAIAAELAKLDVENWNGTILSAMQLAAADEKLDPVVKTQWLVALAETGAKGSEALGKATAPIQSLSDTGVGASFNWTDAEASKAAREKCAAALAALPPWADIESQLAESQPAASKPLNVTTRLVPVGMVRQNEETNTWGASLAEGAPAGKAFVLVASEDDTLTLGHIGEVNEGALVVYDDADASLLAVGRVVYAEVNMAE